MLSNFRPISNLPFISKVLEKVVSTQLQTYLESNVCLKLSSQTLGNFIVLSLLFSRVLNYILLSVDSGNSAVLLLLDLSAAFDTVDHSILISRLEHYVGLKGCELD